MTLTDEEFRLFRNLIYEEAGIYLKEARKDFLENRLTKRIHATGMKSPYWYYKFVVERRKTELLVLLDLLTINETSFFRNKPQMDLFRNIITQELIRKKQPDMQKKFRLWSAGCSTGEEPYTLAMIMLEVVYFMEADIKIYASDLSLTALETASRGEYPADKVHTTVNDYYIPRYFENISSHPPIPRSNPPSLLVPLPTPNKKRGTGGFEHPNGCSAFSEQRATPIYQATPLHPPLRLGAQVVRGELKESVFSDRNNGNRFKVNDKVKKLVVFDFHNLKNDNGLCNLDFIFCRNVMIYFDMEEQRRLINKFYHSLNPGGYLFIGHAESLQGMDTGFCFLYDNGATAYKKPEEEKLC